MELMFKNKIDFLLHWILMVICSNHYFKIDTFVYKTTFFLALLLTSSTLKINQRIHFPPHSECYIVLPS